MHFQQLLALFGLLLVGNGALAAELDNDDVPDDCLDICDPLVSVAQRCERQTHNETAEMDCICHSPHASNRIPHCEACIAYYGTDDDNDGDDDDGDDSEPHDNEAHDILTSCGFQAIAWSPSTTSAASGTGSSSSHATSTPSSFSSHPSSSPSSSGHSSASPSPTSSASSASGAPPLLSIGISI